MDGEKGRKQLTSCLAYSVRLSERVGCMGAAHVLKATLHGLVQSRAGPSGKKISLCKALGLTMAVTSGTSLEECESNSGVGSEPPSLQSVWIPVPQSKLTQTLVVAKPPSNTYQVQSMATLKFSDVGIQTFEQLMSEQQCRDLLSTSQVFINELRAQMKDFQQRLARYEQSSEGRDDGNTKLKSTPLPASEDISESLPSVSVVENRAASLREVMEQHRAQRIADKEHRRSIRYNHNS